MILKQVQDMIQGDKKRLFTNASRLSLSLLMALGVSIILGIFLRRSSFHLLWICELLKGGYFPLVVFLSVLPFMKPFAFLNIPGYFLSNIDNNFLAAGTSDDRIIIPIIRKSIP